MHNIGFDLKLDLNRMLDWNNTTLLFKFSQRSGDSVSEKYVAPSAGGNTFTVQEIYGGQTWKVAKVQFNTLLLDNRLDLAYGRLVANDDFLRSPLYCQFVNNSFCGSSKGLSWTGSVVFSLEDKVNLMDNYFNTALLYEGLFSSRPRDVTGLGITADWYSDELNQAGDSEGKADKDYEAVIELNHKFDLNHDFSITPDLQYIIRPAGTGDIDNALVIGAKLTVQF